MLGRNQPNGKAAGAPKGTRPVWEIERDVMRGKHVRPADLNRFARTANGQMFFAKLHGI